WDKTANDFAGGEIYKIFSDLEPYANIGNPAFSKNSPLIAAFDYFSSLRQENTIFAVNFETGDVGEIHTQNVLGYPSYNKNDDKIAFDAYDGMRWSVSARGLAEDKINGTGMVEQLFADAQWGVYFADGERPASRTFHDAALSGFGVYPNPFADGFCVKFDGVRSSFGRVTVTDVSGKTIFARAYNGADEWKINFEAAPGLYFVNVETDGKTARAAVVKR
ncbi:MAG: T9SS type A sorting domain-containing protein, partial [Bacteroidia bacterium]|nr:T9SS type A sorting domain-containing protein [Bacteroidia bacterium]MDW8334438.1 T9SS type A sorting domain-containing protein [Bacteroidia bacterium]